MQRVGLVLLVVVAGVLALLWSWQREEAPVAVLAPVPVEAALRATRSGPVQGGITAAGNYAWLGIPYAAAPVGELRWRAARNPEPWREPRPALAHGPVCPQFTSALSGQSGAALEPGALVGREDCLSLDIHAPVQGDGAAPAPVMLWIHGGGNSIGSGSSYDPSQLVSEHGVVVVSINYRLGILGWFSHEALRSTASRNQPADLSANFALGDMVVALSWVRDNIEEFGGDPRNVTVFGESAGGRNVVGLLTTWAAKGLFHRAIVQSGSVGSYELAQAENPRDAAEPGDRFSSAELIAAWRDIEGPQSDLAAAVTAEDLVQEVRALPLATLFQPVAVPGGMYRAPQLIRDNGVMLSVQPRLEVLASAGTWNAVPLMVGSNRDEMKLFMALNPKYVERWFGLIPRVRDPVHYELVARYHSDAWKALAVDELAGRAVASGAGVPVFAYRFDWDEGRSNLLVDLPQLLGAAHGVELDFLFEPLISRAVPGLFHSGNAPGRDYLGSAMRSYWAEFARSGNPGRGADGDQPPWPAWTPDNPQLMLLDAPSDGGVRSQPETLTVAALKQRLANDPAITGLRLRCALYVDLFLANGGAADFFDPAEYTALGCGEFKPSDLAGATR